MKIRTATLFGIVLLLACPTALFAAEGANTGTGTSTLSGPAGDNKGPSKMSNPSTKDSAGTGSMATPGRGGDSAAGGGSRNGDHGN